MSLQCGINLSNVSISSCYETMLCSDLIRHLYQMKARSALQAIASQGGPAGAAPPVSSPAMDIFGCLVTELDTEVKRFEALPTLLAIVSACTPTCTVVGKVTATW